MWLLLFPLVLFLTMLGVDAPSALSAGTRESISTPEVHCAPAAKPTVIPDSSLDAFFFDQLGPGWVGGDSTYSTKLPNGQIAFDFSDTLIGSVRPDGAGRVTGIAHNSELLGTFPYLRSDYAGSYHAPRPLIPDHRGHDVWQVAATYVENHEQLVFVNEFSPRPGPFSDFTGRSGIAVLSLQNGTASFSRIVPLPTDRRTQWGNAAMQGAGYTYVYGTVSNRRNGKFVGMRLARFPNAASLRNGAWRYWNGSTWVAGARRAVVVHTGSELTGVMAQEDQVGYQAVSIPGDVLTDKSVDLSYACSPQGPWSKPRPIYAIPEVALLHREFAYIPTFHPELSLAGLAVISYNINTADSLSSLYSRVHDYQPKFLELFPSNAPRTTSPTIALAPSSS
jgi:hypothetical protein